MCCAPMAGAACSAVADGPCRLRRARFNGRFQCNTPKPGCARRPGAPRLVRAPLLARHAPSNAMRPRPGLLDISLFAMLPRLVKDSSARPLRRCGRWGIDTPLPARAIASCARAISQDAQLAKQPPKRLDRGGPRHPPCPAERKNTRCAWEAPWGCLQTLREIIPSCWRKSWPF